MKSRVALIERLKTNPPFAAEEHQASEEDAEETVTYRVQNLCLPNNYVTVSEYVLGARRGYFREDSCGNKSAGTLSFVAHVTVSDADLGDFEGAVYNSSLARPARSYFFSSAEAFPDSLPGMYFLCRGKPYEASDPVEYDLWEGWGATRN